MGTPPPAEADAEEQPVQQSGQEPGRHMDRPPEQAVSRSEPDVYRWNDQVEGTSSPAPQPADGAGTRPQVTEASAERSEPSMFPAGSGERDVCAAWNRRIEGPAERGPEPADRQAGFEAAPSVAADLQADQERVLKLEQTVPPGAVSQRHDQTGSGFYEVDRSRPGETALRHHGGTQVEQLRLTDVEPRIDQHFTFTDEEVGQVTADRPTTRQSTSGPAARHPERVDVAALDLGGDTTRKDRTVTGEGITRAHYTPGQFRDYVARELAESRAAGNAALGASHIASGMTDDDLVAAARDPSSRKTLITLYREILDDPPGQDGARQMGRLLAAVEQPLTLEQREELIDHGVPVFPARFTLFGAAHLTATMTDDDRVHVKIPQSTMGDPRFGQEIRTLPLSTFTSGTDLDPRQLVGVRLYDQGGVTVYRPALFLLDVSQQSTTETWKNLANVGSLGLPGGIVLKGGTLAGGALRGVEHALDATATALAASNVVVREGRGWLAEQFGDAGRRFVEIWDRAAFVATIYGVAKAATSSLLAPRLKEAWTDVEARARGLSGSDRAAFQEVQRSVEQYLARAEQLEQAQARATTQASDAVRAQISAPHGYDLDPRVSGSGGIERIDVRIDARNRLSVTIDGEVLPKLNQRLGFEEKLPLPSEMDQLRGLGYDRAHLWGRQFGDEAAEGVMYAPKDFNVGMQKTLESQIMGLREHLGPGEHLVLRARATSYPRTEFGGAVLNRVEYDFAVVDAASRVQERVGLVFEVEPPRHIGPRWGEPRVIPGGLIWE